MSTSSRITEAKKEYPGKEDDFFTVGDIIDELEEGSSGKVRTNEKYGTPRHMEIEIESTIVACAVALSREYEGSVQKRSNTFRIHGEGLVERFPDSFIDLECFEGDIRDVSMDVSRGPGHDLSITPEYAFCFTTYHEPLFQSMVLEEEEEDIDDMLMVRGEVYTSGSLSLLDLYYITPEAEEYYSD